MAIYPRLRGLSLCAGIGGIELGISLAYPNYRTICYVERESFPAAILAAKMEERALYPAPIWSDVSTFSKEYFPAEVDVITAGYPCQPFSSAGNRKGKEDPRHLWPHISRIIGEYKPKLCIFENVRNHVKIGLKEVLEELHKLGYDAEWDIFSAREEGASHRRERLFILAYSTSAGRETWRSIRLGIAEGRRTGLATCENDKVDWDKGVAQSPICGVDNVLPNRLDRLRALGNAVCPPMAMRAFVELMERIDA